MRLIAFHELLGVPKLCLDSLAMFVIFVVIVLPVLLEVGPAFLRNHFSRWR